MRASMIVRKSLSSREIKVVVASSSNMTEAKAIKFAKKVTKYIRVRRGLELCYCERPVHWSSNTLANRGHSDLLDRRLVETYPAIRG
jgi:hypothetical protein